jgi:hypothetical protein
MPESSASVGDLARMVARLERRTARRVRALSTVALASGAMFGLTCQGAAAAPIDVRSTQAYIQASYALNRAGVGLIAPVESEARQLIASFARQCANVGEGSPQDEASQPMSYLAAVALWRVEYGTAAGPIRRFVKATKRLHWSNPATTRIAHRYARDLSSLASLEAPPLCQDVLAWKLSGFQTIPASALSLVRRVEAIEPEPVPPRLLAPFERGGDASVLRRALQLERRITEQEFLVGQQDWFALFETLGLQQ